MNKINIFLTLLMVIIFVSCGHKKSPDRPPESTIVADHTAQVSSTSTIAAIPGISQEDFTKLLNSCTYVDYIFHDLPFSLSLNEDRDIDQNIMFIDISTSVGKLDLSCKPIARKFFHIKGKIVYDVDVYLSNKCNYFVFVDRSGKPLFANQMTEAGRFFYNKIIKQVTGSIKSQ